MGKDVNNEMNNLNILCEMSDYAAVIVKADILLAGDIDEQSKRFVKRIKINALIAQDKKENALLLLSEELTFYPTDLDLIKW